MWQSSSWVPLPSCSPPRCPFPIKSLVLSACVSSDNSFSSVRQEPGLGPWKGSPFLQHAHSCFWAPAEGSVSDSKGLPEAKLCPLTDGQNLHCLHRPAVGERPSVALIWRPRCGCGPRIPTPIIALEKTLQDRLVHLPASSSAALPVHRTFRRHFCLGPAVWPARGAALPPRVTFSLHWLAILQEGSLPEHSSSLPQLLSPPSSPSCKFHIWKKYWL